jgi:hypothetical protein
MPPPPRDSDRPPGIREIVIWLQQATIDQGKALERIEGRMETQNELCARCQESMSIMDHALHSDDGVLSRLAVLEEKARDIGKLRDRAFVTVKDAFVAVVSSGVTAGAMYVLRML